MQIDIVSDVICPWCFIGKHRLERARALRPDLSATLSWRAFELNPDLPIDGIPREPAGSAAVQRTLPVSAS